ncbi:MAG: Ig-like domain-containing protein [Chitinivibrionia bacterium]|nr:Ig-like domain-containing protein [Chitinivibrionia bacterium]
MKILFVFALSFFLISCANRVFPTGGEGDKTPPTIAEVFPQNQSLNVPQNVRIAVQFSEWVMPRSVESGVIISPNTPFSVRVRGRNAEIKPKTPLLPNTTYHLSFLGDISDFSGNNLLATQNIIFSTGDFIDTSFIAGRIFFEATDGVFPKVGLFFEERVAQGDSVLLSTPDYITQADSLGNFRFDNILESNYRVIGFMDRQGLNRIVPRQPVFIGVEKIVSTQTFQELFPATSDTAQNRILSATAISPTVVLVNSKEKNYSEIKVFNESDGENLEIKEVKQLESSDFSMAIFLSDSLQNRLYTLSTQSLRIFVNDGDTIYRDTIRFNGTTLDDTLRLAKLDSLLCKMSDDCRGKTSFAQNDASDADDTNEHGGQGERFFAPTETALPPPPSAISPRLSWDFMGELPENPLWELKSGTNVFRTTENFLVNIPAGEYRIWLIGDRNQNGEHDTGTLFPFMAGEKRIAFPDVFVARERWETEYEFGAPPVVAENVDIEETEENIGEIEI